MPGRAAGADPWDVVPLPLLLAGSGLDDLDGRGVGQRGLLRAVAATGFGAIGALGASHELLLSSEPRAMRADAAAAWYRVARVLGLSDA